VLEQPGPDLFLAAHSDTQSYAPTGGQVARDE